MGKLNIRVEYVKEERINEVYKQRIEIYDEIDISNIYNTDKKLEKEIIENKYICIFIEKGEEILEKRFVITQLNKKKLVLKNIAIYQNEVLKTFNINNVTYYIYCDNNSDLYITKNINDIYKISQKMLHLVLGNKIVFAGILTNTVGKKHELENIYLGDSLYGRVRRIFKKGKLKHIAFITIDLKDAIKCNQIHNKISLGNDLSHKIDIRMRYKFRDGMIYFCRKKINNKIVILRSTLKGKTYMITQVPYENEYSIVNLMKNNIARIFYKFIYNKNINLIFEKEGMRACESGYYVFEKIMNYYKENSNSKTNTYFIIDEKSNDYSKVKKKYGRNIVEKYSLRHYMFIYASKYFISSELSNHVINPRLYIRSINKVVTKKPLIFLQHGIMFAKPVDNPAAKGFYKSNTSVNAYKNVVCSDLEAEQFYKMGYNKNDLIKTGLPKFDISFMNEDADKVMFMATYRYWEEALVNDDEKIKESTYYKLYLRVIKGFEEANLLDKLIISCHPKFAESIKKSLPQYENLIETDINRGLQNSKIYITDFSSASYDAHYRGAYIIYYWEEKDYLIDNYKAIPPINEDNCDGVPVYNVDQLIKEVKNAIDKKYNMDDLYEKRYMKINEFCDGNNGNRVMNELKKLNII